MQELIRIRESLVQRTELQSCSHGNNHFVIHFKDGRIVKLYIGEPGYEEMLRTYRDAWKRTTRIG